MTTESREKRNLLTRRRFDKILAEEVVRLPPDCLNIYEQHAIEVVEQPCYRSPQYGVEYVFVVARAGERLVLFDDVEHEFAVGATDKDGFLRKWSLHGELMHALPNLHPPTAGL